MILLPIVYSIGSEKEVCFVYAGARKNVRLIQGLVPRD
jgi:hypothetical protein